ncbi:uncharacterized protein [Nicotiana tomentosiformis]|uniref:uncharacterized protein n=1 Tax=Nicotiana tomentosiformis TaxID=4098 RepID=UPI00388C84ED
MAEQVFQILHDSEDELEIMTNDPILQIRQRLEQIGRLNKKVDDIRAEADAFKKNMDNLASKEPVQAQLDSAETQLQAAKEKNSTQAEKIKELQSQLDSAANKLESAKSEVAAIGIKADKKVAQFKVNVKAIQTKGRSMIDHAKWQARREALEDAPSQDFDIMVEVENAQAEEIQARKQAFPEDDSDSLSEFEDGEDPEDGDVAFDGDKASEDLVYFFFLLHFF